MEENARDEFDDLGGNAFRNDILTSQKKRQIPPDFEWMPGREGAGLNQDEGDS